MAIKTIRSGASAMSEDVFLALLTDIVRVSGVFYTSGTSLKVQAQASPDMTVKVKAGRAYLLATNGNCYPVIVDTDTNTSSHGANSSGNPRIDSVVLYVDLSASPNSDATNVAKIAIVAGTPAASPSAPNAAAIQSAIGASNPYIVLSNEAIASGATSITTGNITDMRTRVFFNSPAPLSIVTYAASYAHDYGVSSQFQMTLTGNLTLNAPTNMEIGEWVVARLVQDGTGSRTLTLGTGLTAKSPDMSLSSTASTTSTFAIHKVGSSAFDVYLVGKDY
jgi:hypothetical protein